MKTIALTTAGAALLTSIPSVLGHGYIVDPAAQWTQGYPSNGYGSTLDSKVLGEIDGGKYGYGPNGTVKFIKEKLPTTGGGSLKALISKNQKLYNDKVDPECGLTAFKDSARSKLPASQLEFTGFTHPGPCEVWCDDTKVLFDYDCQAKYPDIPAKIPYDESKCSGANRLTIHWVAVHGEPWQVYTDCVYLEGGSGGAATPSSGGGGASTVNTGSESSSTETTNTAPSSNASPSTNSSPSTNASPSTNTSPSTNSSPSTSTTSTTTTAPSTTMTEETGNEAEAPSAPSTKCARRQ
ncbi:hypothetical protein DVH05_007510 [Phytophthora capsici]|nr:hypothetical protein DVH05_007510 [Phytophthora capsici]|eukprot:jgi/Phyca11/15124/fgenesh1_pg.PHYCAscaffold_11_\